MSPNDLDYPDYFDDRNRELVDLVLQVQQLSPSDAQCRKIKNSIVAKMQASGKIWRGGGKVPLGESGQELYAEATCQAWEWFFKNLDRYDPAKKTVIGWFNYKLDKLILDILRKQKKEQSRIVTPHSNDENEQDLDPLNQCEDPKPKPESIAEFQHTLQAFVEYLEQEKEQLQRKYVSGHPSINCYELILKKLPSNNGTLESFIEGASFEDLAVEFGVSKRDISRCYNEKCLRYLENFLKMKGFRPE